MLITTALMIEAAPVRDALSLQAVPEMPFPLFEGGNCLLVVTGTGSVRAAAATGWILGRTSGIRAAVNLGFAAASAQTAELYSWHRIHSIRDATTGRLHIPDILESHSLKEQPLWTVSQPAGSDPGWDGLVDMEGSGFYEAARRLLPPDRIFLLKWVSDAFSRQLDTDLMASRFAASLPEVLPFLRHCLSIASPSPQENEAEWMDLFRKRLRLSRTQLQFLSRWVRGYLARGGSLEPVLARLPEKPPSHKRQNNRIYEELKDVLKG